MLDTATPSAPQQSGSAPGLVARIFIWFEDLPILYRWALGVIASAVGNFSGRFPPIVQDGVLAACALLLLVLIISHWSRQARKVTNSSNRFLLHGGHIAALALLGVFMWYCVVYRLANPDSPVALPATASQTASPAPPPPISPPVQNINSGSAGVNGTVNGTVNIYPPAEQIPPPKPARKTKIGSPQSFVEPRKDNPKLPGAVPYFHAPAAPADAVLSPDELYRRASLARDIRGDFFLAHRDSDPLDPEQVPYINDRLRAQGESWQITAANVQQMLFAPLVRNITGTGVGTGVALHNSGGAIVQHVEVHGDENSKGVDAYDSPNSNISDVKVFEDQGVPAPAPAAPYAEPQAPNPAQQEQHGPHVAAGDPKDCPLGYMIIYHSDLFGGNTGVHTCSTKICIISSEIHDHSVADIDVAECSR